MNTDIFSGGNFFFLFCFYTFPLSQETNSETIENVECHNLHPLHINSKVTGPRLVEYKTPANTKAHFGGQVQWGVHEREQGDLTQYVVCVYTCYLKLLFYYFIHYFLLYIKRVRVRVF